MIIANTEGLCDRKLPVPAYVGRTPIINASVVKPNEKPGLPGSVFEIATKVIGIVKLRRNIPSIAASGIAAPNASSGADIKRDMTPTFCHPHLSPIIPPKAFPKTIPEVSVTNRKMSDFQGKTTTEPITDLATIVIRSKSMIDSK